VYKIYPPAGAGIDMNATAREFGGLNPFWSEDEILFPGGIRTGFIQSVQQFDDFENPISEAIANPNYTGN
jgi:hypothetical protein